MPGFSIEELQQAYDKFNRVSDECAATGKYGAFADLFTEDCIYVEPLFGEMKGREAVREWIVPLMKRSPNDQMTHRTHDWFYLDAEEGRIVFCARSHMADPGDGSKHSATSWTVIDYAGAGLFSREEDIYDPASFAKMLQAWQAAKDASTSEE